jgi:prolyl oligopeptidase
VGCVLPFIESGGIYAFANLRGGREYGDEWWHAGRRAEKQTTFDDLYAAAEHLIASGITTTDLLAVMGMSEGGLLTAVAATQRPDLFSTVVSQVPVTDMIKGAKEPCEAASDCESGDPQDPDMLPVLLSYSPIHNVHADEHYPAVLVQCGDSDIRCPPWHGRKLVAAMQRATASSDPVLLHVDQGIGHGMNMSLEQMVGRQTEALAFVMRQLGMKVTPREGTS